MQKVRSPKQAGITISQSAARTALGGEGERYVFLKDDDLNTEEELRTNAISQLKKGDPNQKPPRHRINISSRIAAIPLNSHLYIKFLPGLQSVSSALAGLLSLCAV